LADQRAFFFEVVLAPGLGAHRVETSPCLCSQPAAFAADRMTKPAFADLAGVRTTCARVLMDF
jgi:hypothetical protein